MGDLFIGLSTIAVTMWMLMLYIDKQIEMKIQQAEIKNRERLDERFRD